MEVYIDDLVKAKDDSKLISDLVTVFGYLRKQNMRLKPQKCAFTVKAGMFLGFMLIHWGLETNLDKY